jgi:hypothetical protein
VPSDALVQAPYVELVGTFEAQITTSEAVGGGGVGLGGAGFGVGVGVGFGVGVGVGFGRGRMTVSFRRAPGEIKR